MHREDLLVDDRGDWQAVEAVRKGLPKLYVITTFALIIETIYAVDGSTFVIAAQDEEVLGVLDLVGEEQADSLERLLASIDIIAKEEVVRLRWEATVLEQTQQVIVLAVDVTTDLDGSFQLEQDGLRDEDLAGLGAEKAYLGFEKLDLLTRAATSHLKESVDYGIKVYFMLIRHFEILTGREYGAHEIIRMS